MKKFQKLLVISIAVLLMNIAHALEIVDVRSDYWAGQEIVRASQRIALEVKNDKLKIVNFTD